MKQFLILLLVCQSLILFAQEKNENGNFEVSFDKFSLPKQDLIRSLEGSKAMPFLAPDVDGNEQFLGNYQGKVVFIYFMNGDCTTCSNQIGSLNMVQQELGKDVQVIGIMDESKEQSAALRDKNGITFPVLYNGKMLGEAAYGIELGYPRLFAINREGMISQVIPAESLAGKSDIYLQLANLSELVKSK